MIMEIIATIVVVAVIIYSAYYLRYSRPLSNQEVDELSRGRRLNSVSHHYSFSTSEQQVNKEFKKKMNGKGKFYHIDSSLYLFPGYAAGLLKYKKHEWIVIGLVKKGEVTLMWTNKGNDGRSVGLMHSFQEFVELAKNEKYDTILFFHNHPNTNPNLYDCTNPSSQDLITANTQWKQCKEAGMNFIEYICERGVSYRYYLKVVDSFTPLVGIYESINMENGVSRNSNFKLHKERIKVSKVKYDIE